MQKTNQKKKSRVKKMKKPNHSNSSKTPKKPLSPKELIVRRLEIEHDTMMEYMNYHLLPQHGAKAGELDSFIEITCTLENTKLKKEEVFIVKATILAHPGVDVDIPNGGIETKMMLGLELADETRDFASVDISQIKEPVSIIINTLYRKLYEASAGLMEADPKTINVKMNWQEEK